jgi:hypothetical protein
MSQLTPKSISTFFGPTYWQFSSDFRLSMFCPNHKAIHSFPAHREKCNVALREYLRRRDFKGNDNGDATA